MDGLTLNKQYKPLSREFLLSRGYCCHSGCLNCPYEEKEGKTFNPNIPIEWQLGESQWEDGYQELDQESDQESD